MVRVVIQKSSDNASAFPSPLRVSLYLDKKYYSRNIFVRVHQDLRHEVDVQLCCAAIWPAGSAFKFNPSIGYPAGAIRRFTEHNAAAPYDNPTPANERRLRLRDPALRAQTIEKIESSRCEVQFGNIKVVGFIEPGKRQNCPDVVLVLNLILTEVDDPWDYSRAPKLTFSCSA